MLSEMKLLFLIALAYGELQIDCPTIEQFNEIKKNGYPFNRTNSHSKGRLI